MNTASDPLWYLYDYKRDVYLGRAVLIGTPAWGAPPTGLHWIATRAGTDSGGNYPAGDYDYYASFSGSAGVLRFRVKADNKATVILNGSPLLTWGDDTDDTGWNNFSPTKTVTGGFTDYNLLELVVHNDDYNGNQTPTGVLLEAQFDCTGGTSRDWMWQWDNNNSGKIGQWSAHDRYISGRFEGNGKAQLLGFGTTGSAEMLDFAGTTWNTAWSNSSGINSWSAQASDKYVVGDFAGIGRDQLLAINDNNGTARLMSYASGSWNSLWNNTGGKIDWWYMNATDQYTAGDFDGDGVTELLATNSGTGYAHLMKFTGGTWHTIWTNLGNHWISGLYISTGDNYLPGNFDGLAGSALMAIASNGDGYAELMSTPPPAANGTPCGATMAAAKFTGGTSAPVTTTRWATSTASTINCSRSPATQMDGLI